MRTQWYIIEMRGEKTKLVRLRVDFQIVGTWHGPIHKLLSQTLQMLDHFLSPMSRLIMMCLILVISSLI